MSPAPPSASPSPPPASPALPLARSPPPSVCHHDASRPTFLDCACSLFRRTHTKDSNLRPTPSSQAEETSTPTNNDVDADAPLCSICSALDLCAILLDPEERAIPLGQLTSILDKQDQCGLCRLIAVIVRRSWNLDEKPDINVAGINSVNCMPRRSADSMHTSAGAWVFRSVSCLRGRICVTDCESRLLLDRGE